MAVARTILMKPLSFHWQKRKLQLSPEQCSGFYEDQYGELFFSSLIAFMTSGPIIAMTLARNNAVSYWKVVMGPSNSTKARETDPDRCVFNRENCGSFSLCLCLWQHWLMIWEESIEFIVDWQHMFSVMRQSQLWIGDIWIETELNWRWNLTFVHKQKQGHILGKQMLKNYFGKNNNCTSDIKNLQHSALWVSDVLWPHVFMRCWLKKNF